MQIEKLKIEQLIPSDYNPRKDLKPGDAEYDNLKRSIEQFGYVEPVIWNKVTGRVCRWASTFEGAHRYGHHRGGVCRRRAAGDKGKGAQCGAQ